MRYRNVGYFNQPEGIPSQIGVAPRASASPLAKKSAKKVRGLRNELISMNQILGGMVGFTGTEVLADVLGNYFPYNQLIIRGIAGGVIYG
ncbi:hypothetical protein L0244_36695, partial [bacterium]|nr:hypothetical protein [bacterium]